MSIFIWSLDLRGGALLNANRTLTYLLLLAVLICTPPALAFDGPLTYKNQFPLYTVIDTPYLESALPQSSLALDFSYSSAYMVRRSPQWSTGLDLEEAQFVLIGKKSIGAFEAGLEVPFISLDSGFLDGFLKTYHSAFGFGDYGRHERPQNKFLYTLDRDGSPVLRGEGGRVGLGDIRLTAKRLLLSGDPALSVRTDLELPSGSAKKGYGSGGWDAGFGLLLDKDVGPLKSYFNIGMVLPGPLRAQQKIGLKDYYYAGAAIEASVWKGLGLIGQIYYETSPYPRTGIAQLDRPAVLLTLGARKTSGDNSFELAFTEDPSTSGAPDFSLTFTAKRKFR